MDEFDIQTVSDSENPSPSDSSELNSLQLVPDPESENGWRVEKNPSVSLVPVEEVYTEEQLRSMRPSRNSFHSCFQQWQAFAWSAYWPAV